MADIYPKPPSILQSFSEFDEWAKNVTLQKDFAAHLADFAKDIRGFGVKLDGVTDDTANFRAAIASGYELLIPPRAVILLTDTITLGGSTSTKFLVSYIRTKDDMPKLLFNLPPDKDAVVLHGANYASVGLVNITIDMQGTGRDALVIIASDRPVIENVQISNSGRDAFSVQVTQPWAWVENLMVKNLFLGNCGRHSFYFEVGDNIGNFFNESHFENVEVRGLSRRYNGGNFIYADCHGAGAANKISIQNWTNVNVDANRQGALDAGFDIDPNIIKLKYTPEKSCKYESWSFESGGWETTTGDPLYGGYMVYCEDGAIANRWRIDNITLCNWSSGAIYGLSDRVGGPITQFYHLPKLDGIKVDKLMQDVQTSNKPYIRGLQNTRIVARVNGVIPETTKDYYIPFDIQDLTSSGFSNYMVYGQLILCHDNFVCWDQYSAIKRYDLFVHRRDWTETVTKVRAIYEEDPHSKLVLNSLTYDHANKQFVVNLTTKNIGADSGEPYFYIILDIGPNMLRDYNILLTT